MINDTIVALSTAHIESALGVIRMSGSKSFDILDRIIDKPISDFDKNKIFIRKIIDKSNNEEIDQVVLSCFKNPYSFTGEDVVEISCHGGLVVINRIITLILSLGARQALHGEFSKKAFYNNKIDLVQAESINDLITAKTEAAAKVAFTGLKGNVSQKLINIKQKLVEVLAQLEVNVDYPEYEDIEQLTNEVLNPLVRDLIKQETKIVEESRSGRLIKEGIKVALIGKPNAGKSSLLNALIEEDKAIVTNIPGTTRDIVEGDLIINGIPFHLLDTAGIRESDDPIEQLGLAKSKQAIEQSELELIVIDGSEPIEKQKEALGEFENEKPNIIVINKIDISKKHIDGLCISTVNNDLDSLKEEIYKKVGLDMKSINDYAMLSNARQIALMTKSLNSLKEAEKALSINVPLDLVYVDLREALDSLNDILGEKSKENLDDEIFSKFCIGK